MGSLAGATHRGSRKQSQSEHHRAVIPLEDEARRRAARPDSDSDNILRSHAVQQKGGRRRRGKLSNRSPPATPGKQTDTMRNEWDGRAQETLHCAVRVKNTPTNSEIHKKTKTGVQTELSTEKRLEVCTHAAIFRPEIPHRFPGLGWKSIFAVFLRNFLEHLIGWELRHFPQRGPGLQHQLIHQSIKLSCNSVS